MTNKVLNLLIGLVVAMLVVGLFGGVALAIYLDQGWPILISVICLIIFMAG